MSPGSPVSLYWEMVFRNQDLAAVSAPGLLLLPAPPRGQSQEPRLRPSPCMHTSLSLCGIATKHEFAWCLRLRGSPPGRAPPPPPPCWSVTSSPPSPLQPQHTCEAVLESFIHTLMRNENSCFGLLSYRFQYKLRFPRLLRSAPPPCSLPRCLVMCLWYSQSWLAQSAFHPGIPRPPLHVTNLPTLQLTLCNVHFCGF